ncbi:AAA family ATPase [Sulfurospirillum sp. T05]|uniref:AAA family ATPase n=1 Tax=Sulfurospirillum tamanense TaxID=2813362 RepID=A0ABS2WNU4_9BACT|nr:P-loop NTPase fold protein [Sulfurospirillum tamanensis]MBN2963288.1 AAA family ATPase [Sulfurospirillum tamanensis]
MKNSSFPINAHDEDRLGFSSFAKRVAQGILNYEQQEAFVISIEGKWGSGKTSLVNLIENEIQEEVEVMRFNPWLVADLHQVVKLFFDELITVLSRTSFDVKWNEQIKKDIKTLVSVIAPENVSVSTGMLSATWKLKPKSSPSKTQSLEAIKKSINGYLQGLKRKIVIIIDDIDRLTDKETEFIFRLVKGIADFDNVIYLLLYDKEIVARSLETFKKESGEKYLEKIVQYPLCVPKPHNVTLHGVLHEKLDAILARVKEDRRKVFFDKYKWEHVIRDIVPKYILTMRDVYLLEGTLSFEYPIIAQDVNFTDFFLLSLLKIKNNRLYSEIRDDFSQCVVSPSWNLLDKDKIKKEFETMTQRHLVFGNVLNLLFPMLDSSEFAYGQGFSNKDHGDKYLADPYYFENYFAFSVSDDKLSYGEFRETEKLFQGDDFEVFKQAFLHLYEAKKGAFFIEMANKITLIHSKKEEQKNTFYNAIKMHEYFRVKNKDSTIETPLDSLFLHFSKKMLSNMNNEEFMVAFFTDNVKSATPLWVKMDIFVIMEGYEEEAKQRVHQYLKEKLALLDFWAFLKEEEIFRSVLVNREEFQEKLDQIKEEFKKLIFKDKETFFAIVKGGMYKESISNSKEFCKLMIDLKEIETYIESLDEDLLTEEENELLQLWKGQPKQRPHERKRFFK